MRSQIIAILAFVFVWSSITVTALDPGIYRSSDREEKIRQWNAEKSERKKQTIFHTLHNIGEMYMDTLEKLNSFITNTISNSLNNILSQKQLKFQASLNGQSYDETNQFDDCDSTNSICKSDFISKPEHRTTRFIQMSQRSLEAERLNNQSNLIELGIHNTKNPTPRHSKNNNLSLEKLIELPKSKHQSNNAHASEQRNLQQIESLPPRVLAPGDPPYIPADGIVKFTSTESCQRDSKLILIQQTTYYCNASIVSESWYKGLSNDQLTKSNCFTKLLKHEACLCSVDLTGKFCQYETRIFCSLDVLNQNSCPQLNEDAYVSSYSGIPPCVKAKCKNWMNIPKEPFVYEPNSDMVMLLDEQPPSASLPWTKFNGYTYVIDTDELKVTRERKITPQVQYVNWSAMGETVKDNYGDKFYLSHAQLEGTQPFSIILNFKTLKSNMTTTGRYSVEFNVAESIDLQENSSFSVGVSPVKLMYFEDESYIEPQSYSKTLEYLVIISLVLILVFSILVGIIIWMFRSNQKSIKPIQLLNYEPEDQYELKKELSVRDDSPQVRFLEKENIENFTIEKEIVIE